MIGGRPGNEAAPETCGLACGRRCGESGERVG